MDPPSALTLVEKSRHLATVNMKGIIVQDGLDLKAMPLVEAHRFVFVIRNERQLVAAQFARAPHKFVH